MEGNLRSEETWESRLSAGEDKAKVWKDMVLEKKIGYMALLRNLRNIEQQGDDRAIKAAAQTIADPDEVSRSKQLPFRFSSAYQEVKHQDLLEAIEAALEASLVIVPEMKVKTLLAVDASGSMSGDPIVKASMFAAALATSNDTDLYYTKQASRILKVLKGTPLLMIAEKIQDAAMGGGTQTSPVFEYALKSGVQYDRIVIISDNGSWAEGTWGSSAQQAYADYRKSNDCPVYAIDIKGHGSKDVTGTKVRHLTGWSDKLFDYMKWIEQENGIISIISKSEV